ncbi:MAG: ABC transporter ATP-binding protein [Sulfuricurvum sp.]|uniref:ABC transporter ATP-binding protein n=3 Tax=Sulfuricurvum TaxID=286130 RepID=UPI002630285E|nr:ABC transporter ATP-binding protein [Sulfuricurvum sp.]MDD4885259.1 ABC transporter ATP-binding protein [Sulfuricurvum sp.]
MELNPILTVSDLSFSYPTRKVLNNINFSLRKGEVVSLLGPNGCGKSTLIRLMLRLLRPHGGEIWLNNRSIERYSHREIASHIAYIPQYHNVPFNYTVLEMVMMGRVSKLGFFAAPSHSDRTIAREALERIGIESLSDRPFGQLSGGQKQMVLLARALTQEVDTFIMDEPVSGLDYGNQIRLLELINQLKTQGYTFLKTTHYPDHALMVSDRVVVMNGGKIISDGKPDAVITDAMIDEVYGIKAEIITHKHRSWCIPDFH